MFQHGIIAERVGEIYEITASSDGTGKEEELMEKWLESSWNESGNERGRIGMGVE